MSSCLDISAGLAALLPQDYVEWDDEYSALRGNLNTFFNMAVMMLLCVVVIVLGLLIYELLKLPILAYHIVLFVILAGVMARMIVVGKKTVLSNMEKM